LLVSFLCITGMAQGFRFNTDSLFFQPLTLDCNDGLDLIPNQYWTEFLLQCHKRSIYKTSNSNDSYRLLFYGSYIAVIEVKKNNNSIICTIDSLQNWDKKKWKHTEDTLQLKSNLATLNKCLDLLWSKRSIEQECGRFIANIDDSFEWVLEYKFGNKYKVIQRHKPDLEIRNAINSFLDLCNNKNINLRPE